MAQHALNPHVVGQRGCLDFAGGVEAAHALPRQRDGDRVVGSLADVSAEDIGHVGSVRNLFDDARAPTARDELPSGGRTPPAPTAPAYASRRAQPATPIAAIRTAALPSAGRAGGSPEQWQEGQETDARGQPDQHPLGAGGADGGDQYQAEHQGAGDGADRVGRINSSDQPPGVMPAVRRRPPAPAESSLPRSTPAAAPPRGSATGRAERCTTGSATARERSASREATARS